MIFSTLDTLSLHVVQAKPSKSKGAKLPSIEAKSAIVMDRKDGRVLGSKNPDQRLPMASTTKIMTALITIEAIESGKISLKDKVRIFTKKTSAKLFKAGEKVSVALLLKALMVKSANEAALSLALHVNKRFRGKKAKGLPWYMEHSLFVKRMNKRAGKLKMTNTSFVNAHGRDPEDLTKKCKGNQFSKPVCKHYSSARDLAILTRKALSKSLFRNLVRLKTVKIKGTDYQNTNLLLRWESTSWLNSGWKAYGVKTGTTNRAGHCLVAAAQNDEQDLIVVLLGSTRKWRTVDGDDFYNATSDLKIKIDGKEVNNSHRYEDARTLFKWAAKRR